ELHAGSLGWDHGLGNPYDYAPLSGEWADSMTPAALYRELGFTPEEGPEWVSEHLCNTFEDHAEQARAVSAMDDGSTSRRGTHPGSSPGAARLTTTTSGIYAGHINHNREEHSMPDITLKNGDISAYGLACGYVQSEPMGDDRKSVGQGSGEGGGGVMRV